MMKLNKLMLSGIFVLIYILFLFSYSTAFANSNNKQEDNSCVKMGLVREVSTSKGKESLKIDFVEFITIEMAYSRPEILKLSEMVV